MSNWGSQVRDAFETGGVLVAVLAGIILGWMQFKDKISKWFNRPKRPSDVSGDKKIHEKLNELRHDSDACRTKLFLYHNGGYFMGGKSVKKLSLTHESCHPGMVPTFRGGNEMLLSLLVDLMEMAHQNNPTLHSTNSIEDSYFKSYLQSNHVLMFSILPIRNPKGEEIGCMVCEWCAWSFADAVQEDRFNLKFFEARNSVEYVLSTERKRSR